MHKLVVTTFFLAGFAHAADPACSPLRDAMEKLFVTPYHAYVTETAGYLKGKTRESEIVSIGKNVYILANGKWRAVPGMQDAREEMRKNAESDKATCRVMGTESVEGESAVHYSIHQKDETDTIDTQMWISKSRGLPVKQETDTDVGGAMGKSHRAMRYEYTNVKAPAVQ